MQKYVKAGIFLLLIKNLQDPSPDTQVLIVFSFPKATQSRTVAPQSMSILTPSTLLEFEYSAAKSQRLPYIMVQDHNYWW